MTTVPNRPKIKLSGTLPPADKNGLLAVSAEMLDDPGLPRVAIVVLGVKGTEEDFESGDVTVKARVLRVEVVSDPGDQRTAKRLILRASEARDGRTMLPLDTEKDIEEVFASWVEDGGPGVDPDPDDD